MRLWGANVTGALASEVKSLPSLFGGFGIVLGELAIKFQASVTPGTEILVENRVVFGSVNANRIDWLAAVESLDRARERWPELLPQFVGLRVPRLVGRRS